MPLNVEIPLGSSTLIGAVIRVLEGIDGLTTVKVGPALYEDPVPDWSCEDAGEHLSLCVPISNGYRMFLIEHYSGRKMTGDSSKQLARKILSGVQATRLPAEEAEQDRGRRKTRPRQSSEQSVTPIKHTTPVHVMVPTAILFAPANTHEAMIPDVAALPPPTPAELLATIRELAGDQNFVIGLIPKLHNLIGGDKSVLELTVNQLLIDGKLECNDRNIVLERYQRFTLK